MASSDLRVLYIISKHFYGRGAPVSLADVCYMCTECAHAVAMLWPRNLFILATPLLLSAVVELLELQPSGHHQPPQPSLPYTVAPNVSVSCLTPTQHVLSRFSEPATREKPY